MPAEIIFLVKTYGLVVCLPVACIIVYKYIYAPEAAKMREAWAAAAKDAAACERAEEAARLAELKEQKLIAEAHAKTAAAVSDSMGGLSSLAESLSGSVRVVQLHTQTIGTLITRLETHIRGS